MITIDFQNIYSCDFETTVYDGQLYTEVWAAASVQLGTEDVRIDHSIDDMFEYFFSMKKDLILYFHNLAFDGSFIINWLGKMKWTQAYNDDVGFFKDKAMLSKTYKYIISDQGRWYSITLKYGKHKIEIRDSWKLIPFSVKSIGKSFGTKHHKLDMEYKGFRYAGCEITQEEQEYIKNDVLVVKEALEIMFNDGNDKLTIGSCCLTQFKATYDRTQYKRIFPDLREISLDENIHHFDNAWTWINASYQGAWCYVVKGKQGRVYKNGLTADVNSLYPSVMHSSSGNKYPIGKPIFWQGNYIPEKALKSDAYYFIRVKTRFQIKPGFLPFIHIRRSPLYKAKECLETSNIRVSGELYATEYEAMDGTIKQAIPELVLTMTDWELIKKHYVLTDTEIIDGCYFRAEAGIFDRYINHYAEIKKTSKGAKRTEAKLFLNNLYGKMAMNTNNSFKIANPTELGLTFKTIKSETKTPGFIPCGSAITSYARYFTITAAQKNYHGVNKPGFIYADTDSIHCDLNPEELIDVPVHPTEFNHWKLESYWDEAFFTRAKTYIEHITHEDGELLENPYYNIKCAGMPSNSKSYFERVLEKKEVKEYEEISEEIKEYINKMIERKTSIKDFTIGLEVPGKLLPKQIKGGVILVETSFKMKKGII